MRIVRANERGVQQPRISPQHRVEAGAGQHRPRRGELPAAGFPHGSHLRVAWVYLAESPSIDLALERMSETLRRFAASVGKAEKYSSSITAFWMLQLDRKSTRLNSSHERLSRMPSSA